MRNILLASVCAVGLLVSGSAMAQIDSTLSGSYGGVTNSGGGNIWSLNGSALGHLGDSWGVEGIAGYHNSTPGSIDSFNVGGSLFTGMNFGRVAATFNYGGFGPLHGVQYGVGGDWFASDNFTLSIKGGGLSTTLAGTSSNGGYVGGQASWYVTPNFALSGAVDYTSFVGSDLTTENIKAEWLFSDKIPLSVYGGYQHADFAGASSDTLFVGLKLYFDGAPTLVAHQRTGSLGYISQGFTVLGNY